MNTVLIIACNLLAVTILVFGLYLPRYRRKDIAVATLSLNIGVMAVATTLASAEVSAGLGLGLFGVLSIIRLRSSEISQEEIAYYFSALTLGLLAGFEVSPTILTPLLMGAIVLVLFIGDHPRLFANVRHQVITLDSAILDESELITRLEGLLIAKVLRVKVKKVDLINDSTSVDVRYKLLNEAASEDDSVTIGRP